VFHNRVEILRGITDDSGLLRCDAMPLVSGLLVLSPNSMCPVIVLNVK
jgi:hypothetical protein